jgi:hypothetical protein
MAVELKSGVSTDLATVDATSKALRVTNYDSTGTEIVQSLPIAIAINTVTAANNDLLTSVDVSAYKFISVQLTDTWVGTVKFQGSNDNGTFYDIAVQSLNDLVTPYVTSLTAVNIVKVPIVFKYLRIRATAYTSGNIAGTAFGYKEENNTGQISATGEVTIADSAGTVVGPLKTGLDGQEHLPVAALQDVFLSTVNSTENNLEAAQIFTGTGESTKGVNSIDVGAHADQNITIEIQQSHDNAVWDHSYTFLLAANTSTIRNFKALAGYFRIKVTNTSSSATTAMHVKTALTPVSEVLPGALSENGNLKVSVEEGTVGVVIKQGTAVLSEFFLGTTGTNQANVVAAPCILRAITFTNYTATTRHLKLYDTAGTPSAGSSGVLIQCSLPAAGTLVYPLPVEGFAFANGIGRTMTLGIAESDTTPATTANDFSVSLMYQLV